MFRISYPNKMQLQDGWHQQNECGSSKLIWIIEHVQQRCTRTMWNWCRAMCLLDASNRLSPDRILECTLRNSHINIADIHVCAQANQRRFKRNSLNIWIWRFSFISSNTISMTRMHATSMLFLVAAHRLLSLFPGPWFLLVPFFPHTHKPFLVSVFAAIA